MKAAGVLIAAFLFAGACKPGVRPPIGDASALEVNDLTLERLQQRLAEDKKNGKVVVIHFWATWCGPCIEEMPRIAKLHQKLKGDAAVDFMVVAVDEDDLPVARNFVAASGGTFTIYVANPVDPRAFTRAIDPTWAAVLPTTFIYGKDGAIAHRQVGPIDDMREFEKLIAAAR